MIVDPEAIDLDNLLNSGVGNYPQIKELRNRLDPKSRDAFDKVFLLGLREGLYINLGGEIPRNHAVPENAVCAGCYFWDTPYYPQHCRIGTTPDGTTCLTRRQVGEVY